MPKPNFPFSDGTPFPTTVRTPWLGGMLCPVSGGALNTNRPIDHGLGRKPRFVWVVDIGTNVSFGSCPPPHGPSLWTNTQVFVRWPSTGDTSLVLIG